MGSLRVVFLEAARSSPGPFRPASRLIQAPRRSRSRDEDPEKTLAMDAKLQHLATICREYPARTRDPATCRDYADWAISSATILAVRRSEHDQIGPERPII